MTIIDTWPTGGLRVVLTTEEFATIDRLRRSDEPPTEQPDADASLNVGLRSLLARELVSLQDDLAIGPGPLLDAVDILATPGLLLEISDNRPEERARMVAAARDGFGVVMYVDPVTNCHLFLGSDNALPDLLGELLDTIDASPATPTTGSPGDFERWIDGDQTSPLASSLGQIIATATVNAVVRTDDEIIATETAWVTTESGTLLIEGSDSSVSATPAGRGEIRASIVEGLPPAAAALLAAR